MLTVRRVSVMSLITGCAVVLGPVAGAQATDATLRATIKNDVPKITRSQAKILDGLATLQKSGSAKAIVKAINAQDRNLTALKNRVAGQSSSTSAGSKGKSDVTKGLALIVKSNTTLAGDLSKASSGKPVSKTQVKAATAEVKKGNVEINAGAKLLKV
jgi:hypothetical protein